MPSPEASGEDAGAPGTGSVWNQKPWWCQPWSILLTGLGVIGTSWWMFHLWWISAGVTVVITAWWLLFLVLMPAAWQAQQAADQRALH
ncbi:DUF6737 family protein [Synechococcus sp. CCY 9618]|uniref:DUF6737 family protein n=1 Tax=Synechococcus sp. CCY 9618 TaxID=2815602 RepID=UPI001C248464|nr:DUF6737 family protein [Synechococcus sp. CCY 9618]